MTSHHILAVDDEKKILDILKYLLEHGGYTVDAFTEADGALQAARGTTYDLVILDLVMPGTDGYTVAGRLKEMPSQKSTPFLFASAKVEVAKLFLENFDGRADFLQKPFKKDDLLAKVKEMIAGKEPAGSQNKEE